VSPLNAFVPLGWVQEKLGRDEQANVLLVADNPEGNISSDNANKAIKKRWQLADAGLKLRRLDEQDTQGYWNPDVFRQRASFWR